MAGAATIRDEIDKALRAPVGADAADPDAGFDALAADGSTKQGLSEQVVAAMARKALVQSIPGVTFNDVTVHRDGEGQLMRIEVEYLDEVHDPSVQTAVVDFR